MSVDVEIVQPKKSGAEIVAMVVGALIGPVYAAWIVMLFTPIAIHQHPGLWQSFAGVIVVRTLVNAQGPTHNLWTKKKASR